MYIYSSTLKYVNIEKRLAWISAEREESVN